MKRDAMIRELKKGTITSANNRTQASLAKLVEYARGAGKVYKELHVSDEQMSALTKDKLRLQARLDHNTSFQHQPDAPYYSGIKLIPHTQERLSEYVSARLPEA